MTHFWQIFCQYYYPEITRKLPGPGFENKNLPGPDPDSKFRYPDSTRTRKFWTRSSTCSSCLLWICSSFCSLGCSNSLLCSSNGSLGCSHGIFCSCSCNLLWRLLFNWCDFRTSNWFSLDISLGFIKAENDCLDLIFLIRFLIKGTSNLGFKKN